MKLESYAFEIPKGLQVVCELDQELGKVTVRADLSTLGETRAIYLDDDEGGQRRFYVTGDGTVTSELQLSDGRSFYAFPDGNPPEEIARGDTFTFEGLRGEMWRVNRFDQVED